MGLKYRPGTKLRCLKNMGSWKKNTVYTTTRSQKYSGTYGFVGKSDDGWNKTFVEDLCIFKLVKITNWKGELD